MIQKSGDYYICEDSLAVDKINSITNPASFLSTERHQAIGNVKERIQAIRERFNQIKMQKREFEQNQNDNKVQSIFQKVKTQNTQSLTEIDIEVYIPDQILKLDQKLSKIQEKLKPNQIFRRKMESKGNLVQRIKLLHDKLKSVLEKSSQIIVNNIQNYCSSLDDKEDYLKLIFLREAHSKVKGIKEQIIVLQKYLTNLNFIQTKIKAVEPIQKTVKTHSEIIQLRNTLSIKINSLFAHMKKTYSQILQQIDSIPL